MTVEVGNTESRDGPSARFETPEHVTDFDVTDWLTDWDPIEGEADPPTYRYVWVTTDRRGLHELRLFRGVDLDQWCDDTGFDWPPAVQADLKKRVASAAAERPNIPVTGVGLDKQRDLAIPALIAHNDPPVFFRRGGYVTEVVRNERGVPSARLVDIPRMRERLAEVAVWDGRPHKPPQDLAQVLLVTQELPLPPLDSIVEHPVIGKDGYLRTRRGYDAASATYFAPTVRLRTLDQNVHARIALSWLSEMVEDFEFNGPADRANLFGLALTPILRPIIDGSVPMAAITAPRAGGGKTLLAKVVLTALTGRVPPTFSLTTQDDDESEKRLTAVLQAGEEFVFFDNVPTGVVLRSASLARALTTTEWKGRIIRSSKAPTVPIRCTWIATGNNLTMSDEVARRAYLIELTSSTERPDLRSASAFKHPDLLGWVRDNREALLSSLLALVGNWIEAGRPISDGPVLASFEEWSRIVGSVLRNAGGRHFLANEERKRDLVEDESNIEREILLLAIRDWMQEGDWTVKELHSKTRADVNMGRATQPFLPSGRTWYDDEAATRLSYALRPIEGGIYGALKLSKIDKNTRRGGAVYRITDVRATEAKSGTM